jgi:hypothetical protein
MKQDTQNSSLCAEYSRKTYNEIAARSVQSHPPRTQESLLVSSTEYLIKLAKMAVFIISATLTLTSRRNLKSGRKTLQNICSSFVGFVSLGSLVMAAIPGSRFSLELVMCGIASSIQCWVMCWNLSVCERDLRDTTDLRNDEEVLVRGACEERQAGFTKWNKCCHWMLFASRTSSWVFTLSVLSTWWSFSLHWTIMISLALNIGISMGLGLITFLKSGSLSRLEREKKNV